MVTIGERHRRVLELLHEGKDYDEIARIFNVSEQTVRRIAREGFERLNEGTGFRTPEA